MTKAERKNRRNLELCQKIRENDLLAETAAFFHLSEKYLRLIEKQALDQMRIMMNDGKIV